MVKFFNSSATFRIGSRNQPFAILKSVFYCEPSDVVIVFGGTSETLKKQSKIM